MEVASLENCRELYKLSGWDDTHFAYANNLETGWKPWCGEMAKLTWKNAEILPAYDLGYLLRKLPKTLPEDYTLVLWWKTLVWVAQYEGDEGEPNLAEAANYTPENAACHLAIQLFEAGVLGKEKP